MNVYKEEKPIKSGVVPPNLKLIKLITKLYNSFVKFLLKITKYCTYTVYLEYHSVFPLVGIGTPYPLSRTRVCPTPRNQNRGGGLHTRLRLRGGDGESQFGRQERKLL
jgi:hypothetical protein